MKRLMLIFGIILFTSTLALAQKDCTFKGIELKGKVEIVDENADLKVYFNPYDAFDAFKVYIRPIAVDCGEWQIVEYGSDFTVEFVEYEIHADISIYIVSNAYSEAFINKYFK